MNFSVVIPTRNRQDEVIRCLKSIDRAAIEYEGIVEVICINNNSTDDTKKKLQTFLGRKIKPILLEEQRLGPSFARNTGIRKATYDHIIFIDDDIIAGKNHFQGYRQGWLKYPQAAILGGGIKSSLKEDNDKENIITTSYLEKHSWCTAHLSIPSSDLSIASNLYPYSANLSINVLKFADKNKIFSEKLGIFHPKLSFVGAEDYHLALQCLLRNKKGYLLSNKNICVKHIVSTERLDKKYLIKKYFLAGLEMKILEDLLLSEYKLFRPFHVAQFKSLQGARNLLINNYEIITLLSYLAINLFYKNKFMNQIFFLILKVNNIKNRTTFNFLREYIYLKKWLKKILNICEKNGNNISIKKTYSKEFIDYEKYYSEGKHSNYDHSWVLGGIPIDFIFKCFLSERISKIKDLYKEKLLRKKLLDLGCSSGRFLQLAKSYGMQTYGVDISKGAVEETIKNTGSIAYQCDLSIRKTKFSNSFFDIVTAFDLVEHIENTEHLFSEVHRVLKKGGFFYYITPNGYQTGDEDETHFSLKNKNEWEEITSRNFRIVTCYTYDYFPPPPFLITQKVLQLFNRLRGIKIQQVVVIAQKI